LEQYISAIGQDSHRFVKTDSENIKTDYVNPASGDTDNVNPACGDTDNVNPTSSDTDNVNPASGDTDIGGTKKKLILAGVEIPDIEGLDGNSDADVVFHALTNAISGISCVNVLGEITDSMCNSGITDSGEYLQYALNTLSDSCIVHVSISIECARPKLSPYIAQMRKSIARRVCISENSVGITATSGEGLTDFGRGLGIQVFCIVTARRVAL
jgi:2-C-methyl-D-erythritol 2,4-cyclodiphosphate synthase